MEKASFSLQTNPSWSPLIVTLMLYIYTIAQLGRSEDNFWGSVLSFQHVGLGDQTQVVRCGGKYLYPLSHLKWPFTYFWNVRMFWIVRQKEITIKTCVSKHTWTYTGRQADRHTYTQKCQLTNVEGVIELKNPKFISPNETLVLENWIFT